MKSVIVTGWGWADYACAAALALRHLEGKTDVVGVSRRRLPDLLQELTGADQILILGVGLDPKRQDAILKGVTGLKAAGAVVRWLSVLDPDAEIGPDLRTALEMTVMPDADSLVEVVARYLKLSSEDVAGFQALVAADRNPSAPRPAEVADRLELLAAAMFAYRNYQDTRSYPEAIRHLAAGDAARDWPAADRLLVDHYRRYGARELVGHSAAMQTLQQAINDVAPHDEARVLILGESGTGKETIAQQIHTKSPRHAESFVATNCTCLNKELVEDKFFGHEKGAFSGATDRKAGLFELANGGTLFLDEIGELPPDAQALLLRVLEEGRFTRLGGHEEVAVDVRVIAATNRDLAAMVKAGKFRQDLFYRLSVVTLRVPPLREHKEDIAQIADGYWLHRFRGRLTADQLAVLQTYDWPGNVRELFNFLERASIFAGQPFDTLLADHRAESAAASAPAVPDDLDAAIRFHVRSVYAKCNSNLAQTAKALNVARNTVKKYLGVE